MDKIDWHWLMACARADAGQYNRRARVKAYPASTAYAQSHGTKWKYVIVRPWSPR